MEHHHQTRRGPCRSRGTPWVLIGHSCTLMILKLRLMSTIDVVITFILKGLERLGLDSSTLCTASAGIVLALVG